MLEKLMQIDKDLLLFLNGVNSPFFDSFFWIFTNTSIWIPFYITIFVAIVYRQRTKGLLTMLCIVLVIVMCDQISSSIIKEAFERLRPSHEPDLDGVVRLLNNHKSGKFGFVSSHAANSFGLAMFLSLLFKKWHFNFFIFIWAAINSYSRIYLGLHYPGDILGGLILGILSGCFVYFLYKKLIYYHIKGFKDIAVFRNEVFIPLAGGVFAISMICFCAKIF